MYISDDTGRNGSPMAKLYRMDKLHTLHHDPELDSWSLKDSPPPMNA
jgi:hypothetical protein